MEDLIIVTINGRPVIDSRVVARELGNEHASLMRLIKEHLLSIEKNFGRVGFEIVPFRTSGGMQDVSIANLTEDQAIFIGTLCRNSEQAVNFKIKLVSAFSAYRKMIQVSNKNLSVLDVARMLVSSEEHRLALQKENELKDIMIAEMQPKVDFIERVFDADEKIDIGQAAKILELPFGRNTFFKELRARGIFFKNRNEPKQEFLSNGYFLLKQVWVERNAHE